MAEKQKVEVRYGKMHKVDVKIETIDGVERVNGMIITPRVRDLVAKIKADPFLTASLEGFTPGEEISFWTLAHGALPSHQYLEFGRPKQFPVMGRVVGPDVEAMILADQDERYDPL